MYYQNKRGNRIQRFCIHHPWNVSCDINIGFTIWFDYYIKQNSVEGGELFDKVISIDHYDEKTAKLIFYQMVLAIKVRINFQFLMKFSMIKHIFEVSAW